MVDKCLPTPLLSSWKQHLLFLSASYKSNGIQWKAQKYSARNTMKGPEIPSKTCTMKGPEIPSMKYSSESHFSLQSGGWQWCISRISRIMDSGVDLLVCNKYGIVLRPWLSSHQVKLANYGYNRLRSFSQFHHLFSFIIQLCVSSLVCNRMVLFTS